MRQKINLIALGVKDPYKAEKFYEALGWKKSPQSRGDLILFPLGGITLALYPRRLLAEDAMVMDEATGFSGITLSYSAKNKKEVDTVLKQAQKLGAKIIKPAQETFCGGYGGYFKDPDGHIFEVAYIPSWKLDEKDNLIL
ncbi:MAG: VOC family protein [Candidatus Altiarchaeia archaeon]